ncbi:hypothetical protein AAVH_03981 [Aphelenchoides avenae]|nr:hypothetical protein AAVH_03981 [Aphelenchus avenae]
MDHAVKASDSANVVVQVPTRKRKVDAIGSPSEKVSKVSVENDDTLPDSTPSNWPFERLKQVLSETVLTKKREGCVELLYKVLESGSLKQVDLEIRNATAGQRMNIFSGDGATDAAAKDHAAWEALKFLYVFGGFAAD